MEVLLVFVIELDGCRNVLCFNGGICNFSFGNFLCVCFMGYWGEFCELGMELKYLMCYVFYLNVCYYVINFFFK